MTSLVVSVHGAQPAPQGSKTQGVTRDGRPFMRESASKQLKPWRAAVTDAAKTAIAAAPGEWTPLDGDLELTAVFFLRAPKTMPHGRTNPTTKPDLSKLLRAIEDSLTDAKAIVDDARITRTIVEKRYAAGRRLPGVWLRIRHRQDA